MSDRGGSRSKAQKEAGVCLSGKHAWVDGQRRCSSCLREKNDRWHKANPEKVARSVRKSDLNRLYGIDINEVPDTCDACGKDNGQKSICVDHDHTTGRIRGFLCHGCNLALGCVKDDPALLEKLALYLRERK